MALGRARLAFWRLDCTNRMRVRFWWEDRTFDKSAAEAFAPSSPWFHRIQFFLTKRSEKTFFTGIRELLAKTWRQLLLSRSWTASSKRYRGASTNHWVHSAAGFRAERRRDWRWRVLSCNSQGF